MMQWVIENWFLVLLIGGMAAMHLFGHGHGHGQGKHPAEPLDKATENNKPQGGPEA